MEMSFHNIEQGFSKTEHTELPRWKIISFAKPKLSQNKSVL
jgi:hypothetical protein